LTPKISFWDALNSGADRLLSEDMNHGQSIAGLLIENPFANMSPRIGVSRA